MTPILMLVFILTGLGAALALKRLRPRAAPARTLSLVLLGVIGGMAGGLSSLVLFGYGRANLYLYGYTHAGENHPGDTLPAYWMTPLFALVGALLVLAVYRLIRSRLMHR